MSQAVHAPHTDIQFMRIALALAARGLGCVAPEPAAGCVIVQNTHMLTPTIVGRGWADSSSPHQAENDALVRTGGSAQGACAYLTNEPSDCSALIQAGISRVVIGLLHPDVSCSGRGVEALRKAGLDVVAEVLVDEARRLNEGFVRVHTQGRPLVTLKLATSLDGRSATNMGDNQWIIGQGAHDRHHLIRAEADAIMIGSATAIVDDPALTCRLAGLKGRSPIRIVADGRLRLPMTSVLVRSAQETPLWILTLPGVDPDRAKAFAACGVTLIEVPMNEQRVMDMPVALQKIAARGVTRLLVEGGARLIASLMQEGLVNRIEWFQAAKIFGGDGYPAIAGLGVSRVEGSVELSLRDIISLGEDSLARFDVTPVRVDTGLEGTGNV